MKSNKIFITDPQWFESGSLKNPISTLDENIEKIFSEFFSINYDTKILVTNTPTNAEKSSPIYNPYREKYGTKDIGAFDTAINQSSAKFIFLNGFEQEHFDYIAPLIKDTAEIIYFFKCPKISNLSTLSEFANLKCVHIFHNNTLKCLWDVSRTTQLKALSFTMVSNLSNIESLKSSNVEYIHFDSLDNNGSKKPCLFDINVFDQVHNLKYLSLNFTDCEIEKTR